MSLNFQADTREEREPQRGDHVRIGPVLYPQHEWVASFVRWADDRRREFTVDTHEPRSRRVTVKAEALRGLA